LPSLSAVLRGLKHAECRYLKFKAAGIFDVQEPCHQKTICNTDVGLRFVYVYCLLIVLVHNRSLRTITRSLHLLSNLPVRNVHPCEGEHGCACYEHHTGEDIHPPVLSIVT
jgi:hypothetical protein